MEVKSIKLVCFSPTRTTKTIIQAVARGINNSNTELIDITSPRERELQLLTYENELLIVAVPVYMGRVPAIVSEWLQGIKAYNTPVVCIVVYGNRAYENALLELKDILTKCGGKTVAGAAYIGEHSFSSKETPIAEFRPDKEDLIHAELFGRNIKEKLLNISSVDHIPNLNIPGSYPYGGVTELWSVDFIAISEECTQCGICAQVCPVNAIDSENINMIDKVKCITCCACIKNCPQNARTMKPGPVKDAAIRLNKLYKER
ncbi:MAG: EFR1 family ferrodoxin, partial [Bacteroidota bacterium]|nr:EFR1 family ferrodoxin [Bacteroidota bacterium]